VVPGNSVRLPRDRPAVPWLPARLVNAWKLAVERLEAELELPESAEHDAERRIDQYTSRSDATLLTRQRPNLEITPDCISTCTSHPPLPTGVSWPSPSERRNGLTSSAACLHTPVLDRPEPTLAVVQRIQRELSPMPDHGWQGRVPGYEEVGATLDLHLVGGETLAHVAQELGFGAHAAEGDGRCGCRCRRRIG
jgi:hypothetical protein